MTVNNLVSLISYLAPGFIAWEIFNKFFPGKERHYFIQSTFSVIYGILIYGIVKWLDNNFFNNYLGSNNKSDFPSYNLIVLLFMAGILSGFLMTLIHLLRYKLSQKWSILSFIRPSPKNTWERINQKDNTDWAVVFCDDGSIYLGALKFYMSDPNLAFDDQDFFLSKAKRVDENLKIKYEVVGNGVYFRNRAIKRIEFLKSPEILMISKKDKKIKKGLSRRMPFYHVGN